MAGDGSGPAAKYLDPRPRDFTLGIFKFHSTAAGMLPTDEDVLDIRTLRPEGRRAMTPAEFRAGNPLEKGDMLNNGIPD